MTPEQASIAAEHDRAIKAADVAIADLAARIADVQDKSIAAVRASMALADGTSVHADLSLTAAETAQMLASYRDLIAAKRQGHVDALAALA